MIEMDECEFSESDFTDDSLRIIIRLLGPQVAQMLLLPGPVPVERKEDRRDVV
jgi:hypothetical protein